MSCTSQPRICTSKELELCSRISALLPLISVLKITKPVLVLQGEEDWQVTMKDFGIWKEAFGDKENWTMISYPGLIHAMTPGVMNEASLNYTKAEKVDEKVIGDIADFILAQAE